MATATKKNGAPPAPEVPDPISPDPNEVFDVSIFLQVGTLTGDSVYHLRLPRSEIEDILAERKGWIELPESALPARQHPHGETRFIYIPNAAIEMRILNWPKASKE